MNAIKAIVRGGRLELPALPDWPDGTEVIIQPVERNVLEPLERDDHNAVPTEVGAEVADGDIEWFKWYSAQPLTFTAQVRGLGSSQEGTDGA